MAMTKLCVTIEPQDAGIILGLGERSVYVGDASTVAELRALLASSKIPRSQSRPRDWVDSVADVFRGLMDDGDDDDDQDDDDDGDAGSSSGRSGGAVAQQVNRESGDGGSGDDGR